MRHGHPLRGLWRGMLPDGWGVGSVLRNRWSPTRLYRIRNSGRRLVLPMALMKGQNVQTTLHCGWPQCVGEIRRCRWWALMIVPSVQVRKLHLATDDVVRSPRTPRIPSVTRRCTRVMLLTVQRVWWPTCIRHSCGNAVQAMNIVPQTDRVLWHRLLQRVPSQVTKNSPSSSAKAAWWEWAHRRTSSVEGRL